MCRNLKLLNTLVLFIFVLTQSVPLSAQSQNIDLPEGTTTQFNEIHVAKGDELNINVLNSVGEACPTCRAILEGNKFINKGFVDIVGNLALIAHLFINKGEINALGNLLISNLGISEEEFFNGLAKFEADPTGAPGRIINDGTIQGSGMVAAIAGTFENTALGTINADGGAVGIIAGAEKVEFPVTVDGLLSVEVSGEVDAEVYDENGDKVSDVIRNAGELSANGGVVVLNASGAEQVFDNLINHSGIIEANTYQNKNGVVTLSVGSGNIEIDGDIYVIGEQGGEVGIYGDNIEISSASLIDASGSDIGGEVLIVAEDHLEFAGTVDVRGDSQGGFVEISGKETFALPNGLSQIYVSAFNGKSGTLFLDPNDIGVIPGAVAPIGGSPINNNLLGDLDIINFLTFNGSLIIETTGIGGNGDITLQPGVNINWNTPNDLSFNADRDFIMQPGSFIANTDLGSVHVIAMNMIDIQNGSGIAANGGDINLFSNMINFPNGVIQGGGNLTIAPFDVGTSIGIGNGAAGTLNLDTTELGNIADGFSSITIGDTAAGTGAVDVQASTFNDPVTIVGGSVTINGDVNSGANDQTFTSRVGNNAINGGGPIFLTTNTATFNGNLEATNAGLDSLGIFGNAVFNGDVGSGTPLGLLAVGGTTNLGGSITTQDSSVNLAGTVTLQGDRMITSGTGDISLGQVLDDGGVDTLTVDNSGNVDFTGTTSANILGGASDQNFRLIPGSLLFGLDGGGGTNTLTLDNVANTVNINGANTGTSTGIGTTFTNIQNIIGSNNDDVLIFTDDTASLNSTDGLGGNNTIDFSNTSGEAEITGPGTIVGNMGILDPNTFLPGGFDNFTIIINPDNDNQNAINDISQWQAEESQRWGFFPGSHRAPGPNDLIEGLGEDINNFINNKGLEVPQLILPPKFDNIIWIPEQDWTQNGPTIFGADIVYPYSEFPLQGPSLDSELFRDNPGGHFGVRLPGDTDDIGRWPLDSEPKSAFSELSNNPPSDSKGPVVDPVYVDPNFGSEGQGPLVLPQGGLKQGDDDYKLGDTQNSKPVIVGAPGGVGDDDRWNEFLRNLKPFKFDGDDFGVSPENQVDQIYIYIPEDKPFFPIFDGGKKEETKDKADIFIKPLFGQPDSVDSAADASSESRSREVDIVKDVTRSLYEGAGFFGVDVKNPSSSALIWGDPVEQDGHKLNLFLPRTSFDEDGNLVFHFEEKDEPPLFWFKLDSTNSDWSEWRTIFFMNNIPQKVSGPPTIFDGKAYFPTFTPGADDSSNFGRDRVYGLDYVGSGADGKPIVKNAKHEIPSQGYKTQLDGKGSQEGLTEPVVVPTWRTVDGPSGSAGAPSSDGNEPVELMDEVKGEKQELVDVRKENIDLKSMLGSESGNLNGRMDSTTGKLESSIAKGDSNLVSQLNNSKKSVINSPANDAWRQTFGKKKSGSISSTDEDGNVHSVSTHGGVKTEVKVEGGKLKIDIGPSSEGKAPKGGSRSVITDAEGNTYIRTVDKDGNVTEKTTDKDGNVTHEGKWTADEYKGTAVKGGTGTITVTNPDGSSKTVSNTGVVTITTESDGKGGTKVTFDPKNAGKAPKGGSKSTVTDSEGNTHTKTVDKDGNVTEKTTDKDGNVTHEGKWTADEYKGTAVKGGTGTITVTNPDGSSKTVSNTGVVTITTESDGKGGTKVTFDPKNAGKAPKGGSKSTVTDSEGNTHAKTVDKDGNVTEKTTDKDGNVTHEGKWTADEYKGTAVKGGTGSVTVTNPDGSSKTVSNTGVVTITTESDGKGGTKVTFDPKNAGKAPKGGSKSTVTDSEGNTHTKTVDKDGNVTEKTTDKDGNVTHEGKWTADEYKGTAVKGGTGSVTVTNPDGSSKTVSNTGVVTITTESDGKGGTKVTFDPKNAGKALKGGSKSTVTDAEGNTHTKTVDKDGNVTEKTTDKDGNVTHEGKWTADEYKGTAVKGGTGTITVTNPDGSSKTVSNTGVVTITTESDGKGGTKVTFDPKNAGKAPKGGSKSTVTDSEGNTHTKTVDKDGNVTEKTTDKDGNVTHEGKWTADEYKGTAVKGGTGTITVTNPDGSSKTVSNTGVVTITTENDGKGNVKTSFEPTGGKKSSSAPKETGSSKGFSISVTDTKTGETTTISSVDGSTVVKQTTDKSGKVIDFKMGPK